MLKCMCVPFLRSWSTLGVELASALEPIRWKKQVVIIFLAVHFVFREQVNGLYMIFVSPRKISFFVSVIGELALVP